MTISEQVRNNQDTKEMTRRVIQMLEFLGEDVTELKNEFSAIYEEETKMYKFMSVRTGEVVANWKEVLRVMWYDLKAYHILNLVWKYNKKGW